MLKVLLFGNLGSGKSHLAERFIQRHPIYEHVAIDAFRRTHGDGTMARERVAKERFILSVQPGIPQLIEATGLGETGVLLAERLDAMEEYMLIVLLTTPLERCLTRLEQRIWDVPYPALPEEALDLARRTDAFIRAGEVEMIWDGAGRTQLIKGDCSDERSMNELLERMEHHLLK
jgi:adenylate kinase family enzyme